MLAGVQADQVVELVAARPRGFQQLRVDQPLQQRLAGRLRQVKQPTGAHHVQVWPVREAQQPERRGGGLVDRVGAVLERRQGHVEGGADLQPVNRQLVEPAGGVLEPPGELADRPGGAGGQPGAGDADRQRQVAAPPNNLLGRLGVRADPFRAGELGEQLHRLVGRQQV